ncbi:MAG: bifunctional acetaldehyde-CoA/alcohol dehydrogenase [Alphaproteobacteria bacterium]|nr:bifunctional acetaldehyde-CoA/alcohol dehydrogenase [Alphaproteobacteria bacterium]
MVTKKTETVETFDEAKYIDELVAKVSKAQKEYATFPQEKVDEIFRRAALKLSSLRIPLAQMAVEETGMGIVEDKVIKNHFAAEYIYNKFKNTKTCGIISEDKEAGIMKVADPLGVIAGVIPTTNPTSTAIFKALIALKTRNGIIFSPHPRAKKCTVEVARLILEEAVKAGAPENIIGWIESPSINQTQLLMQHPQVDVILATGGPGMVKSAYSSGKPALGVGAGNTPAVIDETADIEEAVSSILISKSFDNGVICASEQSVVCVESVYEAVKAEFVKRGAYLCSAKEKEKLEKVAFIDGRLNAGIVGQYPYKIAEMAGFKAPEKAKILLAELTKVGPEELLSEEKLSPVLGIYKAKNFDKALDTAKSLVTFGGNGHTSVLYTDKRNNDRIKRFGEYMHTGRILINTPSSQGAIGDLYNFKLEPSLTLGCGSWGGNSVSENVGVKHLMNIKTVAIREENMLWYKVPSKIYFKPGSVEWALKELAGKKKAFIITDKPLFELGMTNRVTKVLEEIGIQVQVFADVNPDPDLETVNRALKMVESFQPDAIIALGGGSPMDAAKIIWLMYEQPTLKFEDLAMRFMDIRKRIFTFPDLGKKATMVAIPTTSGTGSEVTPFSIITDNDTGIKYAIADYALTPNMAIIDSNFVLTMPKGLCAASGVDILTHALESYVSIMSSDFTHGLSLESAKLVFDYLPSSYKNGAEDAKAREKVHQAATVAGMAFANAFLGICHSLAHKLGNAFHIPHGIANALLICQVIRYNATDVPVKQAIFPQYKFPNTKAKYAAFSTHMGFNGKTDDEKVENLIKGIQNLKKELNIPMSIKDWGVKEEDFEKALKNGLATLAFDDQCTGANPRYPLIKELEQLYRYAYAGVTDFNL